MAASLSALRAGRTLPPDFCIFTDSWYSFLLEVYQLCIGLWNWKEARAQESAVEPLKNECGL
jgi:hypothetical protein